MPEQLKEQLETAIDLKLQEGVQRSDFDSSLFPTSLLQEWYKKAGVPDAYRHKTLADQACIEVVHQKKEELNISLLNRTIKTLNRPEFRAIRLGVCARGSNSYQEAHRLILNPQQLPLLVHTAQVGQSEQQNRYLALRTDLDYFLRFVQESEAFAPGRLRLIR